MYLRAPVKTRLCGMLRGFLVAVFVCTALIAGKAHASDGKDVYERVIETGSIRCGYVLYPPYLEKDLQTGELKGSAYDFIEAMGEVLGLSIEWVEEVPVGSEVAALDAGRFDSICAITGTYDPHMFVRIDFSSPFLYVENTIYARADDERFDGALNFDDLNRPDITFAGVEGDSTLIYAQLLFPEAGFRELPQLSEIAQLFLEMNAKKADLTIVEKAVALRAMESNTGDFRLVEFKGNLPEYGAALAFSKDAYKLKATVDEAIEYMNANGITGAILDRYDPEGEIYNRVARPYVE